MAGLNPAQSANPSPAGSAQAPRGLGPLGAGKEDGDEASALDFLKGKDSTPFNEFPPDFWEALKEFPVIYFFFSRQFK